MQLQIVEITPFPCFRRLVKAASFPFTVELETLDVVVELFGVVEGAAGVVDTARVVGFDLSFSLDLPEVH